MLRNYFKTAVRSMRRQLPYSLINIGGLSVGFLTSFLILLWVQDEYRYDRFLDDVDQLYRVMSTSRYGDGQVYTTPEITARLDDVLDEDFPEIRMGALQGWEQYMVFSRNDVTFRETGRHAGEDYFKMFSFPFLAGEPGTALVDPDAVVLTESMARRYFGVAFDRYDRREAARRILGQTLRLDDRADVRVSAVIEDVPRQSSVRFEYVLPIEEHRRRFPWVEDWTSTGYSLYVKLDDRADAAAVSEKIRYLVRDHTGEEIAELFLQPYGDIHLRSTFEDGRLVGGRIEYVRLFLLIGVFILLIAAINFVNLTTARSMQRSLEIGIRKSFGASRRELAAQFLSESMMLAFVSLIVALVALILVLPGFKAITNKAIQWWMPDPWTWARFVAVALGTGVVAGVYPSIYLSGLRLMDVLHKRLFNARKGIGLRRGLVLFQFAVSIVLIVGTLTIHNQLQYVRAKNLGLDRENVFYSRIEEGVAGQFEAFRSELLRHPGILSVAAATQNPLSINITAQDVRWEGKDPVDETRFHVITAGAGFVETLGMEVLDGRSFSPERGRGAMELLVNETAARVMGMEDPVDQPLGLWERDGQIVGVVKDFHMASLYNPIQPVVIRHAWQPAGWVYVRVRGDRVEEALAAFEKTHRAFDPAFPVDFRFLDAEYEETYRSEVVVGTLMTCFAGLACFVAFLGLFGLVSFTVSQRTREIAIRKVLGASAGRIALLVSRDVLVLAGVAFGLSVPLAFFVMREWLSRFAYHIDLGPGVFVVAALSLTGLVLLTVGSQSVLAALVNPAESLRRNG